MTIKTSSIDFSGTSQKELRLTGMVVGEIRPVNLFHSGINQISLAFGNVDMQYQGNNQFSILQNPFDFNDWYTGFSWRNAGTALGGAVNYNLFMGPSGAILPLIFGGKYNVIFQGTTTIPK